MQKRTNFLQAFNNLGDIFNYQEPYGNVELVGLVGLFEICFEQAWKAMKEYLQEEGYPEGETGSPRQVLKTSYAMGLIDDEEGWLAALVERNNVAHAYDEGVALAIVKNTKEKYYSLFEQLSEKLATQVESSDVSSI